MLTNGFEQTKFVSDADSLEYSFFINQNLISQFEPALAVSLIVTSDRELFARDINGIGMVSFYFTQRNDERTMDPDEVIFREQLFQKADFLF